MSDMAIEQAKRTLIVNGLAIPPSEEDVLVATIAGAILANGLMAMAEEGPPSKREMVEIRMSCVLAARNVVDDTILLRTDRDEFLKRYEGLK